MAKFLKGINGAYSGKVGSVVGSSWRSIDYVRSLPKKSNKPATEKQLMQRLKFARAVAFLSPIKDVVNLGYSDHKQTRSSGYNQALRNVLKVGISGDYPDYYISYPDVLISKGSMAGLVGLEVDESVALSLTLQWHSELNRYNAYEDDSVIVLLYNVDDKMFSIYEGVERGDEEYVIDFPDVYAGKTIVGWAFVGHRDGVKTSNSQYLGEFVIG